MNYESQEHALRRKALKAGLRATKGICCADIKGWMLTDLNTNTVVAGGDPIPYCLTLEQASWIIDYYAAEDDSRREV